MSAAALPGVQFIPKDQRESLDVQGEHCWCCVRTDGGIGAGGDGLCPILKAVAEKRWADATDWRQLPDGKRICVEFVADDELADGAAPATHARRQDPEPVRRCPMTHATATRIVPPAAKPAPQQRRYLAQATTRDGRVVVATRHALHSTDVVADLLELAGTGAVISVQPIKEAA